MGTVVTYLALLALVWYTAMWLIGLLGWSVARRRYEAPEISDDTASQATETDTAADNDKLPGVSILRPLRGLDCNLYENLESSFKQRYPATRFEIICSVAEEDDPAIRVVQTLMEVYPGVDASLIVGEEVVGINPKINNLVRSYRAAKYDTLWILDSNVQVSVHALGRAVTAFSPSSKGRRGIGLVHHVPFPVFPDLLVGSRVEQAFLSTTHAKMYIAINSTGIDSCVCGKSTLFRKSDLERATRRHEERAKGRSTVKGAVQNLPERDRYGIAAFSEYLGEDNMIGWFIWHELGMRHAMAPDVAGNAVGSMTFEKYFWRRVRWIRVRKYMVVASTLVEPLTESIACGILGAFALHHFCRALPRPVFLLLHLVAWYALDVSVFRAINVASPAQLATSPEHDGPSMTGIRPAFFLAWLVRELCAFPIWLFAMLGNKVSWREDGKLYKVRTDGRVEQTEEGATKDAIDRFGEACFRRFRSGGGLGRYDRIGRDEEGRNQE